MQRPERVFGLTHMRQDRFGLAQHRLSGLGEEQPAAEALEELRPGVAFELRDLDRDRRGREMQLARGFRKTQVVCRCGEYAQLTHGGVAHGEIK